MCWIKWSQPVTARVARPIVTELARMRSMSCAIGSRGASGTTITPLVGTVVLARSSATAKPVTIRRYVMSAPIVMVCEELGGSAWFGITLAPVTSTRVQRSSSLGSSKQLASSPARAHAGTARTIVVLALRAICRKRSVTIASAHQHQLAGERQFCDLEPVEVHAGARVLAAL